MKNILKKLCILVIVSVINVILLSACSNININSNKQKKDEEYVVINKENADVLNIEDTKITNVYQQDDKKNKNQTKIKNNYTFDISNILIMYDELNKNKNIISESKIMVDITLNPGEVTYAKFNVKEYTSEIKITGYQYDISKSRVFVSLKDDNIKIQDIEKEEAESSFYEVLNISQPHKVNQSKEGNTYEVKVKNSSSKDLGNITLKVGQINKDGEYVTINHIPFYKVLKPLEEAKIDVTSSNDASHIEIIGYIYDDVEEKANVDIDFKSHKATINK